MKMIKPKPFQRLLPIIFCLGFLNINSLLGQTKSVATLGKEYMSHYRAGEIAQMEKYLAEDAVILDPTAEILGQVLEVKGKNLIISTLTRMFDAVQNLKFEVDSEFTSGNYVISSGTASYDAPISENQKRSVSYKVFTVLKFENGLVVKHTDYGDYQSLLK